MTTDVPRSEVRRLQLRACVAAVVGMLAAGAVVLLLAPNEGTIGVVIFVPWFLAAVAGIRIAYERGWEAGRRADAGADGP